MQKLQIDEAKARKLFPSATNEFKEMLKDTFGEDFFSTKITDRIKTIGDVFAEAGVDSSYYTLRPGETEDELNYRLVKLIAKVLNEGWVPDWKDTNQYKYYPWFEVKSGSGLAFSDYVYWLTLTDVGSRLCFKSRELAEYAGKQFIDIYNKFLI